jgi:hypothetical protein
VLPPENPLGLEHTLRFQPSPTQAKTSFPILTLSGKLRQGEASRRPHHNPPPTPRPRPCPTMHSPTVPAIVIPLAPILEGNPVAQFATGVRDLLFPLALVAPAFRGRLFALSLVLERVFTRELGRTLRPASLRFSSVRFLTFAPPSVQECAAVLTIPFLLPQHVHNLLSNKTPGHDILSLPGHDRLSRNPRRHRPSDFQHRSRYLPQIRSPETVRLRLDR